MADIPVKIQAIQDTELAKNQIKENKGVLTFTNTKVLLGTGNANIDYLSLIKSSILKEVEVPIIYNGIKKTAYIENKKNNLKNSLVFDSDKKKLCFVDKEAKISEIPIEGGSSINPTYAERYVAGQNIEITDRNDGFKEISAHNGVFHGIQIYSNMPKYEKISKDIDNMIFFVF